MNTIAEVRYPLQSRIRVLVIEDSVQDFDLLAATLGRQGLNVECRRAEDPETFSQALHQGQWDAVVSALGVPALSVADALRCMRDAGCQPPFIVVSGEGGEDIVVDAMRAGADDFLVKGRLERLGPALVNAMRAAHTRLEQQRAESALRESEQRLRELSAHQQRVVDAERNAIAREIHDEIGGMLTALRFDISWIERNTLEATKLRAAQALETLTLAQSATQHITRNLRPPVLDAGIVPALQWQLAEFRKRTGCAARLMANTETIALSDEVAMAVYRTLQEALTNIVKHANATRVDVDLVVREGMLSLEIHDDGKGIGNADIAKASSYGLRGLAERARSVGGWMEVSPGRSGTALLLTVPATTQEQPR